MERFWDSRPERVRAPYTKTEEDERDPEYHETRETLWEIGGPPPKAKYYPVTDSVQYREGKVKRTPGGE